MVGVLLLHKESIVASNWILQASNMVCAISNMLHLDIHLHDNRGRGASVSVVGLFVSERYGRGSNYSLRSVTLRCYESCSLPGNVLANKPANMIICTDYYRGDDVVRWNVVKTILSILMVENTDL